MRAHEEIVGHSLSVRTVLRERGTIADMEEQAAYIPQIKNFIKQSFSLVQLPY